jgi:phage-related protein
MAVVKNMMVRAGADFSAITKQASKASNSMRGMQNSVSRSCNAMSKAAAGLKKAFAAVGVAVSLGALVSAAKDAAAAYDEQVQNEVRLAQAMRNTMSATNDEIQSVLDLADAQEQLGVIDANAQIAGAQELSTYLSTADALKELIPAMNDMAVQQYGYNVTAEQTAGIATMLGKVMEGQTGALSRYGYYFSEAEEHILKFGTEAERAATLARIVEQSVGGMNQALASTPTGRMKQLSNTLGNINQQFGQAVRTLGTVFLPLLNKVAQILAAVATLANKVAQAIANVFGGKSAGKEWKFIPQTTAAVSDTADTMDDLSSSTDNLTSSTNKAATAAKKMKDAYQQASFDTLNILKENTEDEDDDYDYTSPSYSPVTGGSGGGDDASDMIQEIDAGSETAGESVGWLESLLGKLKEKFEDFKAGLDFTKLRESWDRLKEAVKGFAEAVGGLFASVWERVLKPFGQWTINEALPRVLDVLAGLFNVLAAVINKVLRPAFEWLWDHFLEKIAHWAADAFIKALEQIADLLDDIARLINGEMSLGQFLAQLSDFQRILVAAAATFVTIKTGMLAVKAVGFAKHIAEIVSGFWKFVTGAGEVVKSAGSIKGAMEAGLGGISTTILGITGVLGGLNIGINGFVSQWENGMSAAGAAVTALGVAIAAVSAVILGAPAAVAAIVGAVVFVVAEAAVAIHDHWDQISEFFKTEAQSFKDGCAATAEEAKQAFGSLKEFIVNVFTGARDAAIAAFNGIKEGVQSAIDSLKASIEKVKAHFETFKDAAAKAVDGMKSAWNGASEWFRTNVSEPLIQWGEETWETIKKKGQDAGEKIKETWQSVREFFREIWNGVRSLAAEAFETAREKGVAAWNAIQTAWGRAKGFFNSSVFQPMVAAAQRGVQGVIGWFDKMLKKAREAVAGVREAVSKIGEGWSKVKESAQSFGTTLLDKLSSSKLVQTLANIKIPHLAAGAVIPPNREFAAVLGDQTSGMNIETPEKLLREIVREESGNSSIMMMLSDILDAILDGKEITLDGYRVGKTLRRYQAMAARANG